MSIKNGDLSLDDNHSFDSVLVALFIKAPIIQAIKDQFVKPLLIQDLMALLAEHIIITLLIIYKYQQNYQ